MLYILTPDSEFPFGKNIVEINETHSAKEVSFEWNHYGITSSDLKVGD